MEKSHIYLLSLIRSSPGNKIAEEELTLKVREDISQNKGPYAEYSSSYRMTRFNNDIIELISKGFLHKVDTNLEMPWEAVQFFDKLPKPAEATKENIQTKLHEYLNNGHALKLDILRLISEEADDIRASLKNLMWSEKAIELALNQLSTENIITSEYRPKFKTDELKKEVKRFFEGYRDNAIEMALDKRNESERLQVALSKYKKATPFPIIPIGIANLLLDFANDAKSKKVEVLSAEFGKLRLAFNQKLYEISYKEEELTDIPYFDTEKALILCSRVNPVFTKNFCNEFNAENRKKCAIYNLRTLEKFNVTDDALFYFFEGFLQNRFNLSFNLQSQVFEKTQEIITELSQTLKKEKEESAKKKAFEEGFLYTQISIPWALGTKIEELFKKSKSIIRISNPYIDNSTFHLLQAAAQVKILMLVTHDRWLETKISESKLGKKEVQKTLEKKRIEIKIIPNLHARFIIIDDEQAIFLSSDLQTDSLTSKYQYGFWTNNSDIIRNCVSYFDSMWSDAEPYDLIKEIDVLESKRKTKEPKSE
jgi:hypothetical protein